jgi:hypothetical protein
MFDPPNVQPNPRNSEALFLTVVVLVIGGAGCLQQKMPSRLQEQIQGESAF